MPTHSTDREMVPKKKRFATVTTYLIGYVLFGIFILLLIFLLFRIRINIVQIGFLLGYNQGRVKGMSNLGVLISGVLMLIAVVFSEDYLRKGIEKDQMWIQLLRIFLVEGVVIALSLSLYFLLA